MRNERQCGVQFDAQSCEIDGCGLAGSIGQSTPLDSIRATRTRPRRAADRAREALRRSGADGERRAYRHCRRCQPRWMRRRRSSVGSTIASSEMAGETSHSPRAAKSSGTVGRDAMIASSTVRYCCRTVRATPRDSARAARTERIVGPRSRISTRIPAPAVQEGRFRARKRTARRGCLRAVRFSAIRCGDACAARSPDRGPSRRMPRMPLPPRSLRQHRSSQGFHRCCRPPRLP